MMIHRDGHMIIHGKREGRNLKTKKLKPWDDLRSAKPVEDISTVCSFRIFFDRKIVQKP